MSALTTCVTSSSSRETGCQGLSGSRPSLGAMYPSREPLTQDLSFTPAGGRRKARAFDPRPVAPDGKDWSYGVRRDTDRSIGDEYVVCPTWHPDWTTLHCSNGAACPG